MLLIKKYHSSSTICEKSQVDVFKITPTGSSQKRGMKNTLYTTGKCLVSSYRSQFSPKNVIFGLRELCTIENWIPLVLFFYTLFLTASCGRNFEDIDLRFFANCRRRMVVFFPYAISGHLLIILSWIENLKKDQFYQKTHFFVNIDHVFFWRPVFNVLLFL